MARSEIIYTLRYRGGDHGTVIITRQALAAAGVKADKAVIPAFSSRALALAFRDEMDQYLAGPVVVRRWPVRVLATRAFYRNYRLRIDPKVEIV